MSYSRRFRFSDGKSSLHRVEFAREFDTRLAGAARQNSAAADGATRRTVALPPDPHTAAAHLRGTDGAEYHGPADGEAARDGETAVGGQRPRRPML